MPLPLPPTPATGPVALGLVPGARLVGLAVLSQEELLAARILSLYKLDTGEGKETRFRQVVSRLLSDCGVSHVVLVRLERHPSKARLVENLLLWLQEEARARSLPLSSLKACEVREALVPAGSGRATNRRLADHLATCFPELRPAVPGHAPCAQALPLPTSAFKERYLFTPQERYWKRMFLAVGGALVIRDRLLLEALTREAAAL